MADRAAAALSANGHSVEVSDLAKVRFDPVSDRRNFLDAKDQNYLKQQAEELHASDSGAFVPVLATEMDKLEQADLLVFSFPLWWFGMPALLKGWVDRVLAMGRIYGGGKWYENGVGGGSGRAIVLMTTGGAEKMYSGRGLNPPMEHLLIPVHHGVFWFNGFRPLDPFIAWGPARMSDDERFDLLESLERRMSRVFEEEPRSLLRADQCGEDFVEKEGRFRITLTQSAEGVESIDQGAVDLLLASLRREGKLLAASRSTPDSSPSRMHLVLRAQSRDEARETVTGQNGLPFETIEIEEIETLM